MILYGHPGCGHYRATEEFLRKRGVTFEQFNILQDPEVYDEVVTRWGIRSSVTLVIDGEVVIGFQECRARLAQWVE